jgi:hypothetical protein
VDGYLAAGMCCLVQVAAISFSARAAGSRVAAIQPVAYRRKVGVRPALASHLCRVDLGNTPWNS